TLTDIWAGRLTLKPGVIVVADACDTGRVEVAKAAEEHHGFPVALLAAGASSVVATLWRVVDFSTSLLIEQLFACLIPPEVAPREALRRAGTWLRSLDREAVVKHLDGLIAGNERDNAVAARVSTLPDDSTSRFVADFRSIRTAVDEVGEQFPFAHPYFWA